MRFWTVLQYPFHQAALVEDGKITARIPEHAPKTIARRAACVGEYRGHLVIMRHASIDIWDREGTKCIVEFHHKLIYAPHAVVQFGDDLLICSSGLDLFLLMDATGKVKWEWWGKDNELGGVNPAFDKPDWETQQVTSDQLAIPDGAHFNSIWLRENSFWTAALKKKAIVEITLYKQGYKTLANAGEHGVHSPIIDNGRLIYGTQEGIIAGDKVVWGSHECWPKYIRRTAHGFVFTHELGVTFVDKEWKEIKTIDLPRPFQLAYLEE